MNIFQANEHLVSIIDPSELLRPEPKFAIKPVGQFRDYSVDENDPIKERVRRTYEEMHTNQTVDFVEGDFLDFCINLQLKI